MPVSVVAYISFSHYDITGARRTHVRHLERVDVVVTMRRHHLLHELLRQYLRLPSAAAVTELTLCVDDNNGDAKAAYAFYGFRQLQNEVWVLDELEGLRADQQPLELADLSLEFHTLADARHQLTCQFDQSRPSRDGSVCMQITSLAQAGLLERQAAGDEVPGTSARAALELIVGDVHSTIDLVSALLPRTQLGRKEAQQTLTEALAPLGRDQSLPTVQQAVDGWLAARVAESNEIAAFAPPPVAHPLAVQPAQPTSLTSASCPCSLNTAPLIVTPCHPSHAHAVLRSMDDLHTQVHDARRGPPRLCRQQQGRNEEDQ